jgi:hypothetical protein
LFIDELFDVGEFVGFACSLDGVVFNFQWRHSLADHFAVDQHVDVDGDG